MDLPAPGTTFQMQQGADIVGGMERGFQMGEAFRQQREKREVADIMRSADLSSTQGQEQAAQKIAGINPQLGMNMMTQVREREQMKLTQQRYQELAQERADELRERQRAAAEKARKDQQTVTNARLTNISENTARMYNDYEDVRDDQIKKGSNPKDAEIFARQKVGGDWDIWRGSLGTRMDEEGNPIFTQQQIGGIPQQFDPVQAKNLTGMADAGIQMVSKHEAAQRKAEAEARKLEVKAPTTRNVIHGEKEQTEEFDPKTGQWKPIGEAGPRFAAEAGAAEKGTVLRSSSSGDTYVMAKDGKVKKLEDDGSYSTVPASQVPKDLVKPGAAGAQGGREAVFNQRIVTAGNQVAKALNNITQLPLTSSTGVFGGRQQGPGFLDAGKATLANKLTTQEVQSYNTMSAGIQRSLAAIEASGLAPSGTLSHQMDSVIFREGDSNLTKLQKLAETRQIVEGGMEVVKTNPHLSEDQRKQVDAIIASIQKSVPFTQEQLLDLQREQIKNPKATLRDVMPGEKKIPDAPPAGHAAAPQAAIDKLRANPDKRDDFVKLFGYLPPEFQRGR
jgi:hypothetical protein